MAHAPLGGAEYLSPELGCDSGADSGNQKRCPQPRSKGAVARGPLSRGGAFASFQPMDTFLPPPHPQYKGTWKSPDLLSASILTTKIEHSRVFQLGKKTSAGVRNSWPSMMTVGASPGHHTPKSFGKKGVMGLSPQVRDRPGVVQRKASSGPLCCGHGPRSSVQEAGLMQKYPSEKQAGRQPRTRR